MHCTACGHRVNEEERFCEQCGESLSINLEENSILEQEPSNVLDDEALLKAFVGVKKQAYYFGKWEKNEQRSWNWAAFFASLFWLGYRKMYKHLFGILALYLVVDIVIAFLGIDSARIDSYIGVGVAAALGILGNFEYKKFAQQQIEIYKKMYPTENLLQKVRNKGGTSVLGAWLTLPLVFGYAFVSFVIQEIIYFIM